MKQRTRSIPEKPINTMILIGVLMLMVARSSAQTLITPAVEAGLHQPIHFQSGTTLRPLLDALTQQTGVKVQAQSCLLDRVMTLNADGQSGLDVLTALVDIYDWHWAETNEGVIYISRRALLRATTLPEIQEAVRQSLPTDFRRYLGFGISIDTLSPPRMPDGREMEADELSFEKKRFPKKLWETFYRARHTILEQWLDEHIRTELAGKPSAISYKHWSHVLKDLIITKVMLTALDAPLPTGSFYRDQLLPYQSDINITDLRLYNEMLTIGDLIHKPNTESGIIYEGSAIIIPEEIPQSKN